MRRSNKKHTGDEENRKKAILKRESTGIYENKRLLRESKRRSHK